MGANITLKELERGIKQTATRLDDSNPFWIAFRNGVTEALVNRIRSVEE